jgi:hypothetical protein
MAEASPLIVLVLLFYGLMFFGTCFVIWKFYQVLSKINDNIAGIRQALERTPFLPRGGTES